MTRALPAVAAILIAATALSAQDSAKASAVQSAPLQAETGSASPPETPMPAELAKDAMRLALTWRIVSRENPADAWDASAEKLILPNRALSLRMVGKDIVIVILLTAVLPGKEAGSFTLKAQGQAWVRNSDSNLSYYLSNSSLSLRFGERALFYPLGSKSAGKDVVEVEISLFEPEAAD